MKKSLKPPFQPILINQKFSRKINLIELKKPVGKEPKTTFSAYIFYSKFCSERQLDRSEKKPVGKEPKTAFSAYLFKSKICSENQFDRSEKGRLEKNLKLQFQPIFLIQKFYRKISLIDLKKNG